MFAAIAAAVIAIPWSVHGDVPGGMEVAVDVSNPATFKSAAVGQTQATFCLFDAETGGAACDCHTLPMSALTVQLIRTERFDGVARRRFARISAVLGDDPEPAELCDGPETWVELKVGSVAFGRKRLQSAAFAKRAETAQNPADISVRAYSSVDISVLHDTQFVLPFDNEHWDTASMHPTPDNPVPTSHTECLYTPTGGKYLITGQVIFEANAAGYRDLAIRLQGDGFLAHHNQMAVTAASVDTRMSINTHFALQENDCVELNRTTRDWYTT
jgi:hypothetical protein